MSRFQQGNPGGPGRPRQRISKFRAMLGELTGDGKEIAEGLRAIANDPESTKTERLKAYELLLSYLLGRPEQMVAVEADIAASGRAAIDMRAVLATLPTTVIDQVTGALEAAQQRQFAAGDDDQGGG